MEGKINHFSSVQFSSSVMSVSLQPQGLQHTRLPCPSPTSGACSNSCPLSRWCHPTISFSVVTFSSCLQFFPASESFLMSQFCASGGKTYGVSDSAIVPPMNIQDWFPLGLPGLISAVQGTLRSLLQHHCSNHQFFGAQLSLSSNSHICTWLLEKPILLTRWTFVGKVMSLVFNTLSSFVIDFLPRVKHPLVSWLQSSSEVTLEPKKIKYLTVYIVSPSICHELMGLDAMIFIFWMLSFKPAFLLSSFTFKSRGSLVLLHFLP